MGYRVLQNSFLGGVISPALLGRVDLANYQQGAYELTNFIVQPQGSVTARGGFRYVAPVKDHGKRVRLIPFRFASDQTLVLVFGDKWMRIVTEGKVLLDGGSPYEIESPYSQDEIFELEYTQNADIVTLTNPNHPPIELRRYDATDWRFEECSFAPSITPPAGIVGTAIYPPETDGRDKDTVEATYVVTAIDENGKESQASAPYTINCNYYLTGGRVELTWAAVPGAVRYRVYRSVAGVFGFLGETEGTSILDEGDNPDATYTPPRYEIVFENKTGIKSVEVLDGGSGYASSKADTIVADASSIPAPWGMVFTLDVDREGILGHPDTPDFTECEAVFALKAGKNSETDLATSRVRLVRVKKETISLSGAGDHTRGQSYGFFMPSASDGKAINLNFSGASSVTDARICFRGVKTPSSKGTSFSAIADLPWNRHAPKPSFTTTFYSPGTNNTPSQSETVTGTGKSWFEALTTKEFMDLRERFPSVFTEDPPACYWRATFFEGCPVGDWAKDAKTSLGLNEEPDVKLIVNDPTGTGAELQAVVQDGKIVQVVVIKSGENYTNPTITVEASQGSGAKFKVNLFTKDDFDYPSANTQYDQRRIFAGSYGAPVNILMTNAGQQDLMMYHLPTMADDRIVVEAVTADADRIIHAVALDSLLLFTRSAELRVFTQNSDALSPDSVAVRAQSYIGANQVQPVIANANVLYAASRGGHLRTLSYTYTAQGYSSDDLSLVASHLFDGKDIVDMTLSKAPTQIVWCVSSDGHLNAMTYYPEQNICAWSVFETDGAFESCCVVNEGIEDHLYVVVRRTINGTTRRYIERLEYVAVPEDNAKCRQFDCFVDNQEPLMTMAEARSNTLTGLEHLEGKTVVAFVDGTPAGEYVVQGGSITIDRTGSNVAVGLPYKSRLITVPLAEDAAQGKMQSLYKNISSVFFRIRFAGDLWASAYGSNEVWQVNRNDLKYKGQDKGNQTVNVNVTSAWRDNGQILIEHRDALPLEISAIVGETSFEGYKK